MQYAVKDSRQANNDDSDSKPKASHTAPKFPLYDYTPGPGFEQSFADFNPLPEDMYWNQRSRVLVFSEEWNELVEYWSHFNLLSGLPLDSETIGYNWHA